MLPNCEEAGPWRGRNAFSNAYGLWTMLCSLRYWNGILRRNLTVEHALHEHVHNHQNASISREVVEEVASPHLPCGRSPAGQNPPCQINLIGVSKPKRYRAILCERNYTRKIMRVFASHYNWACSSVPFFSTPSAARHK